MTVPRPTPIYRLMHLDNLSVCLERGGMHAPNHTPNDGRVYRTIHDIGIQQVRRARPIRCGVGWDGSRLCGLLFWSTFANAVEIKDGAG